MIPGNKVQLEGNNNEMVVSRDVLEAGGAQEVFIFAAVEIEKENKI